MIITLFLGRRKIFWISISILWISTLIFNPQSYIDRAERVVHSVSNWLDSIQIVKSNNKEKILIPNGKKKIVVTNPIDLNIRDKFTEKLS